MVELEMVLRTPDPKDRRYVLLSLTSKGEEQYQAISKTMENYIQGVLQLVPENKRDQVVESLGPLGNAMNHNTNDPLGYSPCSEGALVEISPTRINQVEAANSPECWCW